MAKTRAQKEQIVERLKEAFSSSPATAFVRFSGISVSDEKQIRDKMRELGLSYYVAKKTLMRVAWQNAGIKGDEPTLEGEIAVVYGTDDPTAPAREIYQFVKKFKDNLEIEGGIFEGEFKDKAQMNEIATIPSHDTLKGMFVNVINSPLQKLVVALDQIAQQKEA